MHFLHDCGVLWKWEVLYEKKHGKRIKQTLGKILAQHALVLMLAQLHEAMATDNDYSKVFQTKQATLEPIDLPVTGSIPPWLDGYSVVRNGAHLLELGDHKAIYPLDGMSMLHRFSVQNGRVSFRSRYVESSAYLAAVEHQRFVFPEFGTPASPDPNASLFSRLKAKLKPSATSDNVVHNVFFFDGKISVGGGGSVIHIADKDTLQTVGHVQLDEKHSIDVISDHPVIDADGSCYLLASSVRGKPTYKVFKIPPGGLQTLKPGDKVLSNASLVATVPGQFTVTPCLFHSFAVTQNYIVLVEVPMQINVLKILTSSTIRDSLEFDSSVTAKFYVIEKATGRQLDVKYEAPSVLFFHTINAYEQDGHIILDTCSFGRIDLKAMFPTLEDLRGDYYRKRVWQQYDHYPSRYVLPLLNSEEKSNSKAVDSNLVTLPSSEAVARLDAQGIVRLQPERLVAPGQDRLDDPAINPLFYGKPYRYFYGSGLAASDYYLNGIGKVDVSSKTVTPWLGSPSQFASEALFIARPGSQGEDDGVVVVSIIDTAKDKADFLLFLDAATMTELARACMPGTSLSIPWGEHGVVVPPQPPAMQPPGK